MRLQKTFLIIFILVAKLQALPNVVNWMQFPFHANSPSKQFYLELEFHNPSVWVSDWGSVDENGRINIITQNNPEAIVPQVLYNAGHAYTVGIEINLENISIFVDGVEIINLTNQKNVEFEYSRDLNKWQKMTLPIKPRNYFIRINTIE